MPAAVAASRRGCHRSDAVHGDRAARAVPARRGLAGRGDAGRARPHRAAQPALNGFCLVAADEALAAAAASEARWQGGEPVGPLDGVPTSIKDLILTRGLADAARGSRTVDPDQPWDVDAPATARLREAGAVLIGKTTTPEFGCKGETNSPLTGITRNPWDPTKTPGGSSGGTAAAVAAGLGPLSVGTDGAGSVRIPAAFCGNFGLKPSFGRVPAYPLSPFGTVSHLGPHTMSVADAALMMNVLQAARRPRLDVAAADRRRLPRRARRRHRRAAHRLLADARLRRQRRPRGRRRGRRRRRRRWPRSAPSSRRSTPASSDPLEITTGLWFTGAWTLWNTLTAEQQAVTDPDFAAEAELGAPLSSLDVQRLELRRGELGSQMRQFMQRFDLLVTPAVAVPAFEPGPAGHDAA